MILLTQKIPQLLEAQTIPSSHKEFMRVAVLYLLVILNIQLSHQNAFWWTQLNIENKRHRIISNTVVTGLKKKDMLFIKMHFDERTQLNIEKNKICSSLLNIETNWRISFSFYRIIERSLILILKISFFSTSHGIPLHFIAFVHLNFKLSHQNAFWWVRT